LCGPFVHPEPSPRGAKCFRPYGGPMTRREWNVAKEAQAWARFELGQKGAPPGPDSWRQGPDRVTVEEGREIRAYVHAAITGDLKAMRRAGRGAA
jgi:hypothetical protein